MTFSGEPSEQGTGRPNIILILADDMGYSDIGCFGSEIATPNLDRLAAGGVRMTQMYNCARCCPTRASLLTGLYPHQAGVGHMVDDKGLPAYQGYLNDRCVTIAEALGRAGYRTLMSGKWHCGGGYDPNRPESWAPGSPGYPTPSTRGFEEHYGTVAGGGNYFNPYTLMRNDRFITPDNEDFYYTDAISDEASAMIDRAASDERPFFLHVAYTAPHWPLHALEEDIARYENTYRDGWDAVRTARHERLKGDGVLDSRWPISARDASVHPWQEEPRPDWEKLRMAVYAAQVDRMDQGIGRILQALERNGMADNTLVMFLSDNGGCAEFLHEDGPHKCRYDQPTLRGESVRVGNIPDFRPGPATTFMSYETRWANASNTPFRLYKHWVHEGGVATPLIAHWPGHIPAGHMAHSPAHVVDLMTTCLDAAGAEYPEEYDGRAVTPTEGESILPALSGVAWHRSQPIYWEHEGNRAVRLGEWKLVSRHPESWELYEMNEDRTELCDLAGKNRPVRKALAAAYDQWALRCDVEPWPVRKR